MSVFSNPQDKVFEVRRKALVKELLGKGIFNNAVLEAIGRVPRHLYMESGLHHRAYEDIALPIAMRQTISQPYTVARQSELLEIKPGEKVLEIGTGSGYQASVLAEMKCRVYSIERHRELYEMTRQRLQQLGYKMELKCGDGTLGWSAYAPYDAIIVTAGAPVVPEALKNQLVIGGRLVIPVGDDKEQTMMRIIRTAADRWEEQSFAGFKFVPLIGKDGWDE
jgi:protein-L-isoaspartate(D-aspartate) O-methyltransferase